METVHDKKCWRAKYRNYWTGMLWKKTKESSSPGDDIKFLDEVETARKYVNELQGKGINKIIIVSHSGYEKKCGNWGEG